MPLYPPAAAAGGGGAIIGSAVVRKNINLSALVVGNNQLLAIAGGLVRIESLGIRVTTAAASAGAPTLDFNYTPGSPSLMGAVVALATLALGATMLSYANAATGNAFATNASGADPGKRSFNPGGSTLVEFAMLNSQNNATALNGIVAVTTYTGGVLEIDCVYTPLTSGAALS